MESKYLVILLLGGLAMAGCLVGFGHANETLAATALGGVLGIATQKAVTKDPSMPPDQTKAGAP